MNRHVVKIISIILAVIMLLSVMTAMIWVFASR